MPVVRMSRGQFDLDLLYGDRPSAHLGGGAGAGGCRLEQLACHQRLTTERQAALVGPCEHEQVVGQAGHAPGLLRGGLHGGAHLLGTASSQEREVELGAQGGQRRAQLVACVAHH